MTAGTAGEGEWESASAVGDIADAMASRGNSPAARALLRMLADVDEQHRMAPESDYCSKCGHGDTTWPCADWMVALNAAVRWMTEEITDLQKMAREPR